MKNLHRGSAPEPGFAPERCWLPRRRLPVTMALGAIALTAIASPGIALSAERLVYGRVINSLPLPAAPNASPACEPLPPLEQSAGLTATLQRELIDTPKADADCAARDQPTTAYRVRYLWNDREFETILAEPPGRRIVLRLSVD